MGEGPGRPSSERELHKTLDLREEVPTHGSVTELHRIRMVIERSWTGPLFYWALSLQVDGTGRVDPKVVLALLKGDQQFLQQNPDPRCLGRVFCGIHPQVGNPCGELLQGSEAVLEQFQGDGGSGEWGHRLDAIANGSGQNSSEPRQAASSPLKSPGQPPGHSAPPPRGWSNGGIAQAATNPRRSTCPTRGTTLGNPRTRSSWRTLRTCATKLQTRQPPSGFLPLWIRWGGVALRLNHSSRSRPVGGPPTATAVGIRQRTLASTGQHP